MIYNVLYNIYTSWLVVKDRANLAKPLGVDLNYGKVKVHRNPRGLMTFAKKSLGPTSAALGKS